MNRRVVTVFAVAAAVFVVALVLSKAIEDIRYAKERRAAEDFLRQQVINATDAGKRGAAGRYLELAEAFAHGTEHSYIGSGRLINASGPMPLLSSATEKGKRWIVLVVKKRGINGTIDLYEADNKKVASQPIQSIPNRLSRSYDMYAVNLFDDRSHDAIKADGGAGSWIALTVDSLIIDKLQLDTE